MRMISAIVAMSKNRVIGRQGALPWRLPEDLKRFKAITLGHPIVMGRKTFDSIGRVLPGRQNIVVSRQVGLKIEGADVVQTVDQALELARANEQDVFIVGGGEIYSQTLPRVNRLYLTLVHQEISGDAYFPVLDWNEWEEVSREDRSDPISFSFLTLMRKMRS